jgi:ribosomal subunit interface protein
MVRGLADTPPSVDRLARGHLTRATYAMQLSVSGKHVDLGDALRGHVTTTLMPMVDRYFGSAIEAKVLFARERHLYCADIAVHVARGMMVQSRSEASDAYAAFDGAAERLQKRLQRYKGRLIDRRRSRAEEPQETVPHYVLAANAGEAEDPEHGRPAIVAEQASEIAVLSVGEAVMRLDLGDLPILMFRNRMHQRMNVIYRRPDGTVGWIDPPSRSA